MSSEGDLITWLRQQIDQHRVELEQELAEYLGTHREHSIRFQLAEVEAKRRILDHIAGRLSPREDDGGWESADAETDGMASTTLRLLAQPYAGRDGWQEEWRV